MKGTVLFLSSLILGSSIAVDINPDDQSEKLRSAIGHLLEVFRLVDLPIPEKFSKLEERVTRLEEKAGNTQLEFYSFRGKYSGTDLKTFPL